MRLLLGLWSGHSRTLISVSFQRLWTDMDACFESLSCRKAQQLPTYHLIDDLIILNMVQHGYGVHSWHHQATYDYYFFILSCLHSCNFVHLCVDINKKTPKLLQFTGWLIRSDWILGPARTKLTEWQMVTSFAAGAPDDFNWLLKINYLMIFSFSICPLM